MMNINVTKTYLPPFEEYATILKRAWDKGWITNNGELVQELEAKLKEYLGVKHLLFCSNGTIVLQMAIKALGLTKEIITTPFSYVATANAIAWEGCTPVFVDIEPSTFTIDPDKIEAAITENTQAILATHVYGFPCNVEAIQEIAERHHLKVIYDGAHAFGSNYKERSLLSYGDISTCSFHATKLFHTVEGGCITTSDENLFKQMELFRQFGHRGYDYFSVGINAKNSEMHAAMGLCLLPKTSDFIKERKYWFNKYRAAIGKITHIIGDTAEIDGFSWNYSYMPVLFDNIFQLNTVVKALADKGVFARKYFSPSLNTLPFYGPMISCPISQSFADRVLSLPFFVGMTEAEFDLITNTINSTIGE